MTTRVHLIAIDPQRDFCDPNGSLYVKNAEHDMDRLAVMMSRLKGKLDDIHITLDSHHRVHISHPIWWKDSSGKHPNPFTAITVADVEAGTWTTTQPGYFRRSLSYLKELAKKGRYTHVIWPEHCLIGSEGAAVNDKVMNAALEWESRFAVVDFVTKGAAVCSEHFSAVGAEVPDPEDPSTQINTGFVETLEKADILLVAGEALSHCVYSTVRDIAANFSNPKYIEKIHLLTDASSSVTGFEAAGDTFIREMTKKGMKLTTTKDFLV